MKCKWCGERVPSPGLGIPDPIDGMTGIVKFEAVVFVQKGEHGYLAEKFTVDSGVFDTQACLVNYILQEQRAEGPARAS